MKHIFFSLAVLFLLASCNKKNDPVSTEVEKGSIEFSFTTSSTELKSANNLEDVSSIMVTLEDVTGNIVIENKKIKLFKFNDSYTSEPMELTLGEYTVSKFWVINEVDEVLYATPKEGSSLAHLVSNPLPVSLTINKDEVTTVGMQVIATDLGTPEDFGHASFKFEVVDVVQFCIAPFLFDEGTGEFVYTTASIKVVSAGKELYSGELEALNNTVYLTEDNEYIVEISKEGYRVCKDTLTLSEIAAYSCVDGAPYKVILEKITEIVLQPGPAEAKDAHIHSMRPDEKRGDFYYFEAQYWTWNGQGETEGKTRSLIDFDWSNVPEGSLVKEAKLYLYSPQYGVSPSLHSKLSGSNECILKRIISPWEEETVTWNTQPTTTDNGMIVVPESTSDNEDYVLDITSMVNDILSDRENSHGMMMMLKTEAKYRRLVFASSDSEHSHLVPKLVMKF